MSVLQDAELLAAGQAASGAVSVRAVELARGVTKAMAFAKVKIGVAAFVMIGLLTSGAGVAAWQTVAGADSGAGQPAAAKAMAESREVPKQAPVQAPPVEDAGKPRVDSDGNPLPENALARMGSLAFCDGRRLDHVAVSPDGAFLATIGYPTRLWDVKSGREMHSSRQRTHHDWRRIALFSWVTGWWVSDLGD